MKVMSALVVHPGTLRGAHVHLAFLNGFFDLLDLDLAQASNLEQRLPRGRVHRLVGDQR